MLVSNLKHFTNSGNLIPNFEEIINFINNNDLLSSENKVIDIIDRDLFCIVSKIDDTNQNVKLECHRKYIDLHFVLEGEEHYGWSHLHEMKNPCDDYSDQDDFTLFDDDYQNVLKLNAGNFVVFYPEDCHAPTIFAKDLKKLVFKIKIQ